MKSLKPNDIIIVDEVEQKGEIKILRTMTKAMLKKLTGEMSYDWRAGQPFPQSIGITLDGREVHIDKADLPHIISHKRDPEAVKDFDERAVEITKKFQLEQDKLAEQDWNDTVKQIMADDKDVVAVFPAGYNRNGIISCYEDTCDVCHLAKPVISIDSSEGEYGPGRICKDCASTAFSKFGG